MGHGTGNGVIHHIQAGISVNDDVVDGVLHHITDQFLGFPDSIQHAVVAAVGSILTGHVCIAA